jgi:hypothetical protein
MTTNAIEEDEEDEEANDEAACGNSNNSRPAIIGVDFISWREYDIVYACEQGLSCFPPSSHV